MTVKETFQEFKENGSTSYREFEGKYILYQEEKISYEVDVDPETYRKAKAIWDKYQEEILKIERELLKDL